MTNYTFRRSRSVHATADLIESVPSEVRAERAKAIQDFERRRALEAARQEVEAARVALNRVRDAAAEEAALDAALTKLAEIEREGKALQ
ncbi:MULTISPECIES: hypothetical protein [unclassified Bradyrhizobium]|uniref:hypothetical protein n=1 Tax=unclassified Bradyrhizobium TaxID=2631580 RepID=UPI0028E1B5DC|nr:MULTISPECIES: hypothetical protein [unclassified Bradyrhizobium]